MDKGKDYQEWMALRTRLFQEERALARARVALQRGNAAGAQELSIKRSEIRALRALSRAVMWRALGRSPERDSGFHGEGPAA